MPRMRSESLVLQRDITDHSLEEAILRARSEPFFMRHSVSFRPMCELCIRLLLHNQQTNFRSGCTTELRNQLDTCINIWSQRDFVSYNWLLRCRNFIFISNIYLSSYMYVNFGSVIWNFICLPSVKKKCAQGKLIIQIIRVVVHVFRTKENVKRTLIMKKNT